MQSLKTHKNISLRSPMLVDHPIDLSRTMASTNSLGKELKEQSNDPFLFPFF